MLLANQLSDNKFWLLLDYLNLISKGINDVLQD